MIRAVLDRLVEIVSSEGPGYTDHPEVDIETHRSLARWNRWLGYIALGLGLYWAVDAGSWRVALFPIAFALLLFWASATMRLEALEWQVELHLDDRGQVSPSPGWWVWILLFVIVLMNAVQDLHAVGG